MAYNRDRVYEPLAWHRTLCNIVYCRQSNPVHCRQENIELLRQHILRNERMTDDDRARARRSIANLKGQIA